MPGLIPRARPLTAHARCISPPDWPWPISLVAIASTSRGLRQRIRDGYGLWITPCRGVHTLAMRFPIDVVYLDRAGTVVHVEQNLPPWRFAPVRLQAASVIELPCRTVASTGTSVGDKIEITVSKGSGAPPA